MMVLMGHVFILTAVPVAFTPVVATITKSSRVFPSAVTVPVALRTAPLEAMMANQAHSETGALKGPSVFQWSAALTSFVGTSSNSTVMPNVAPAGTSAVADLYVGGR